MPGELRGKTPQQRDRNAERTAALAAALRAPQAARDVLAGGAPVVPPTDIPPEPPGMEGMIPPLPDFTGGGLGSSAAPSLPGAGAGMPPLPPAPGPAPTMPAAGAGQPQRGLAGGGVVESPSGPVERPPALSYSLTRTALEGMLPPGVRPVGNIIPAPVLFHTIVDALQRQREGRPLPEYAAGGVVDDDGRPLPDFGMETITSGAALDDEETMLWDGAQTGPPGPEVFEDYLSDPEGAITEPDDSYAHDFAELYDAHPGLATGLWNITVSLYDKDAEGLSEPMRRMVEDWRGSRRAEPVAAPERASAPPPPPEGAY